ncbi:MAG: 5-formyltetrahydrofolate cyclo-ligase [Pyrinomonadaceae bacterium]
MTKAELRKIYLTRRGSISPDDRLHLSEKIAEKFFAEVDLANFRFIHCFISLQRLGEIETAPIFQQLWQDFPQIETFAPRINEQTNEIDALPCRLETKLIENKWNISEPADGDAVDPKSIDMVIVPLLCFDERGFRVGYGKGFYDRFLAKCRPDCVKVGLSFFPPVERIDDINAGDVALDLWITPEKIIATENTENF